jgi:hypothetical protein
MVKVHQEVEKMKLVCDRDQLFQIMICLAESPKLSNRMLAADLSKALENVNEKG